MKSLRVIRIILALAVYFIANIAVVTGTLAIPAIAQHFEQMQIVPAVLAFSLTTFVTWLAVTLLLGRVYCSVVCPLGIFQDIVARVPRLSRKWRRAHEYHYGESFSRMRFFILGIFVVALPAGIFVVYNLLDPTTIYNGFIDNLFHPAWQLLRGESLSKIVIGSMLGLGISIVTIIVVTVMAVRRGRLFCNTICPVGTLLGLISRHALMNIDINTDRCTQCRRCEHVCKSQCINLFDHTVDASRCVNCFDCIDACRDDAITYTINRHQLSVPMLQRIDSTPGAAAASTNLPTSNGISPSLSNKSNSASK